MLANVTVTVKDDERTNNKKFMDYHFDMSNEHKDYIKQTIKEFEGEPDDVILTIKVSM